jgi:hypothetical protein
MGWGYGGEETVISERHLVQVFRLIRRPMPNEISSREVYGIRVRWITRIRCVVELAGPTDIKRVALTGIKRVALTGIK